ncbi:DUF4865 family protein [Azospirillum endophyticum]
MIAMQYSFVLPADYDMTVIDRRIREKGPLLDGFPCLRFKAYLAARKQGAGVPGTENLYAPFYLWDEPAGVDGFLSSPGFAAVTRDFGWPSVQTWLVWHADLTADLKAATHATREVVPIAAYSDLAAHRDGAIVDAGSAIEAGALAAVAAFDPTRWSSVKFTLWPKLPTVSTETMQLYTVGHVSLPKEG